MREGADASSVVRAADSSQLEKRLKLLSGKHRYPLVAGSIPAGGATSSNPNFLPANACLQQVRYLVEYDSSLGQRSCDIDS
jgi:hypothetical protein